MPRDLYEHCIKEMEENKDEPYSVSNEFGEALFAYAQKHYAYAQIINYNGMAYICLTEESKFCLFLRWEKLRQKLRGQMDELSHAIAQFDWKEKAEW